MNMNSKNLKCEHLNGTYNELANLLGIDAVFKLYNAYRGQQISFPVQLYSREFIVMQIVNEYDGHNIKQLATKFGYSEKWVRKILKEHIDEKDKKN